MREVLDRLREAETALDSKLMELYYTDMPNTIHKLWQAKKNIWYAQMHTLNAAAEAEPEETPKSTP